MDNEAQLAECYEQLQAIMRATAYKDGSLSTFEDESDAKGSVSGAGRGGGGGAGWRGCCPRCASRRGRGGGTRQANLLRHSFCPPPPPPGAQANAALEFFTDLMLEQYMDGAEVDVDIVMSGGEVVYANVVDNWPTFEPWFQVGGGRRGEGGGLQQARAGWRGTGPWSQGGGRLYCWQSGEGLSPGSRWREAGALAAWEGLEAGARRASALLPGPTGCCNCAGVPCKLAKKKKVAASRPTFLTVCSPRRAGDGDQRAQHAAGGAAGGAD